MLIRANYFPREYSDSQIGVEAEHVIQYQSETQQWEILRPPSPVETGGVTVYWSDLAGPETTGVEVLNRIYLFVWNDVEFFFACQEGANSTSGIIVGCDRIFSTLRLGKSTARPTES